MTIELTKEAGTSAARVLVFNEAINDRHPFVRPLSAEGRTALHAQMRGFSDEFGASRFISLPSGQAFLVLGRNAETALTLRTTRLLMRAIIAAAKAERLSNIALRLEDLIPAPRISPDDLAELIAAQAELANFEFNRYKEPPKTGWRFVERLTVVTEHATPALQKALMRGVIVGQEMNKARGLANTPSGEMTPLRLAEAAIMAGRETGFNVSVLDEAHMSALGMGGILGVARGSNEPPRFLVLEYLTGRRSEHPTVLVGKGVTFDSGGLNLKPSSGIYEMHMDMSGGAAVIHTIAALARLGVKRNIVGLIPAVENMPSGSSYHPGDLLQTMSGKTIEVLDTDAEGRIILADALTYAERYKPARIIDIATLTGAAMVALGQRASALFTNDVRLEKDLRAASERTGDYVWPLPLWSEYEEDIKGTFGDVANVGKTRYGGAITGAAFLWQFVKHAKTRETTPAWAHVDMAPRMTTIDGEYLGKGATGAGVYLFVDYLRRLP